MVQYKRRLCHFPYTCLKSNSSNSSHAQATGIVWALSTIWSAWSPVLPRSSSTSPLQSGPFTYVHVHHMDYGWRCLLIAPSVYERFQLNQHLFNRPCPSLTETQQCNLLTCHLVLQIVNGRRQKVFLLNFNHVQI